MLLEWANHNGGLSANGAQTSGPGLKLGLALLRGDAGWAKHNVGLEN